MGALFISYNRLRGFGEEERRTFQTFANHAALALKKAKLLNQIVSARNTASVVAEVTALGKLRDTLDSIVNGSCNALRCDAVTLYTYDNDRKEFGHPPAMAGVDNTEWIERGRVTEQSVVSKVLEKNDLYIAEDAKKDPLLGGPFTEREDVETAVAIPLIAAGRKVGVMFVNYRVRHRFTEEEKENIKLFASQAAVAVRNGQLYDKLPSIIGNRTATEWIDMVSNTWKHNISRDVGTARRKIALLNLSLSEGRFDEMKTELDRLEEIMGGIKDILPVEPLSWKDGTRIQVNDLVKNFMERRWDHARYRHVELDLQLQDGLDSKVIVWGSWAWLQVALEQIVDNSVRAIQEFNSPVKKVTVITRLEENAVQIAIRDTGPGIPLDIRRRIFNEPITKEEGANGSGTGLIFARSIIQTYEGDLELTFTGRNGTEMVIFLPVTT